jgi:protein ImuB
MSLMCALVSEPLCVPVAGALEAVARACSPRVTVQGEEAVVFDAGGLERVLGSPAVIAGEVARLAAERAIRVRIAVAGTATAATLLARARPGITLVAPGEDAAVLASLPLEWLATIDQTPDARRPAHADKSLGGQPPARGKGRRHGRAGHSRLAPGPESTSGSESKSQLLSSNFELRTSKLIEVLHSWGLRTFGDLARLPRGDLHARLGPIGVRLHQTACGEDIAPMVPVAEAPRFVERIELEWPIDGLEPLSFVLARQCEALAIVLERADRGAVTITTTLRLTTRAVHARVLHLPAPMRDARVLRTLILLDLESHPPPAAIDVVDLELEVTPGRITHGALFARTLPSPEDLATLVARLGALMGETRIGAPAEVDTFDVRTVGIKTFQLPDQGRKHKADGKSEVGTSAGQLVPSALCLLPCIRRYRLPLAASVALERGRPVSVLPSARAFAGGRVVECAGPWRSSGAWWALDRRGWDRDEWDVQLADGAVYRIANDRGTGQWVIEGTVD